MYGVNGHGEKGKSKNLSYQRGLDSYEGITLKVSGTFDSDGDPVGEGARMGVW